MSRRVSHISRDTVMHHILLTRLLTSHVSVSRVMHHVIITPSLTPEHVTRVMHQPRRHHHTITDTRTRDHVSLVPGQVEAGDQC